MSRTLRPLAALAMIALLSAGRSNTRAETGTRSSAGNKNAATAPAETGTGSSGGSNAPTRDHAVKFAQCIRDNGVKDFPDPTPDGPLVDTNRIPSAAGDGIAAINAAMQKCRDLAANAGAV